MNIVFFGSDAFGLPSLKALLSSKHHVCSVVTIEDKPKGRYLHVQPDEIKAYALEKGIACHQPHLLKDPVFLEALKKENPDLLVVASFGKLIPNLVLSLAHILPISVHPSLLPRYRGASPIQRAILDGQTKTGVTISRVTSKLDSGEIVAQKEVEIGPDEDAPSLYTRLAEAGAELLLTTMDRIESKNYRLIPQNESESSYATKIKKEDGKMDWTHSAQELYNHIRAMKHWPSSFTFAQGKQLKILEARPHNEEKSESRPGTIVKVQKHGSFFVQTGEGWLEVLQVQLEGKAPHNAYEFLIGQRLHEGAILG